MGRIIQNPLSLYKVIDHILPKPQVPSTNQEQTLQTNEADGVDQDLWSHPDAVVLQWICGTISNDLLHTIIETNATAQQAWERLASIFKDNKNARALYLENQFSHVQLDDFPNISALCQELKMLADQLANVGTLVSNQ